MAKCELINPYWRVGKYVRSLNYWVHLQSSGLTWAGGQTQRKTKSEYEITGKAADITLRGKL